MSGEQEYTCTRCGTDYEVDGSLEHSGCPICRKALSSPATDSGDGEGKAAERCPACGGTGGHWEGCRGVTECDELRARITALEADKRRLEEVIKQAACDLTCREDDTHFCPICDNSLYNAKVRIDAALAREDVEKTSQQEPHQTPRELPKSGAAMEQPEAKDSGLKEA